MAREELARLLSRLLKRGQSARRCDDLAEFKSRLFAELLHGKNSFRWFRFLLLRGTAESGALKAKALPGGARRLAVRAVKGASFAFIGAKRETLDRRSGRSRRRFSAGRARRSNGGSKDAERNCPFYVDILGSLAFVVVISVAKGLAMSGPNWIVRFH